MAQSKNKSYPQLLIADSETSADMLYLSGFFAPDAFTLIVDQGKRIGVLSRLEIDRARKASLFDTLHAMEALMQQVREKSKQQNVSMADVVAHLAAEHKWKGFRVPENFPAAVAFTLQKKGLEVMVVDGAFVPERLIKSETEVKAIRQANKAAAAGIRAVERALKRASIQAGKLKLDGKLLTSERLRFLSDVACLEQGAVASQTIVAGGQQACDPHCRGSGVLRANELIVVDVFPRVSKTGYHGDMTRTFLKGQASDAQKQLIETVRLAQFSAIEAVKPGVDAATVHRAASQVFDDHGYKTEQLEGRWQGFFHSTGHGLGLAVHEAPRVSERKGTRLRKNMVFTIEPGLYYPEIGGCRIEDVIWCTTHGPEKLSEYHYNWQL